MSLSLPIAVLVGVRTGRMLNQLHLHDMEEKISNLALEVLKEKIFNHLQILYQVYSETPQNIPTGVNFQATNITIMSMPIESMLLVVNSNFLVFSVSSNDMMVRGTITVESINSIQGSGPFSLLGECIRF
ncbi:hypothetical protein M9H77_23585 [Catharanthus roseus]|uniref:Uncharacterized protein n=1 Tax=Catharanthus roseus TaxID=4058 RepID=A0ACC0AW84_CATRO|nr:hypothetical protein M9H77_23585 [Catharanthus roseus]